MIFMYVYLLLCSELNRDADFCIIDKFLHHARIHACRCKSCKKNFRILMQSTINRRLHDQCLFINYYQNHFIILNDLSRHLITKIKFINVILFISA